MIKIKKIRNKNKIKKFKRERNLESKSKYNVEIAKEIQMLSFIIISKKINFIVLENA